MLPDAPDDGTARPGFPVSAAVLLPDFPVPAIDAALPGVPASADAPPAAPSSDEGAAWPAGGYICGPAGMDEALARTINESMQQVKDDPTFVEGMASMSQVIEFLNLEESRASFEAEWQLQVELTTNLGINIRN